jgi:hypothetical protein
MIGAPRGASVALANSLGLHALRCWAETYGIEATAEAFGMPQTVVAVLTAGGSGVEGLAAMEHALWSLSRSQLADGTEARRASSPALQALWSAQEAYLAALVAHWGSGPLLAVVVFDVSPEDASSIAAMSSAELGRRARTLAPALRLRAGVLAGRGQNPMSVALRMPALLAALSAVERRKAGPEPAVE